MIRNGERNLLARLSQRGWQPRIIFDVGANEGDWTDAALVAFPKASVHLFEPAPALQETLGRRFSGRPVTINALALSDRSGTAQLEFHPATTQVSTLHHDAGVFRDPSELIEVGLRTGDEYCASAGVSAIDFLKIDAEGHDLAVLKGFTGMIEGNRVHMIQFEHNEMAIASRTLLRDFYDLIGAKFRIGKIMPTNVDNSPYTYEQERFYFANYLAVRRDELEG
jgi:FkbM family methyltransferase